MHYLRFSDLCAAGKAAGKQVFIRADLNVPQDDQGNITEDTRIRASVACIRMALDAGAAVMVTSHLGRPTEGSFTPADSLAPVARRLGELLGREVPLVANWVDGVRVQGRPLAPGQLVMLENCRVNKGEKKNSEELARKLKLAGLMQAPVHIAVLCDEGSRHGHGLGRATMPEMLRYSVVCAVHTFWLAARMRGLGVGWVSILDPAQALATLSAPADHALIAYLCVGWPETASMTPELEREGWQEKLDPASSIWTLP